MRLLGVAKEEINMIYGLIGSWQRTKGTRTSRIRQQIEQNDFFQETELQLYESGIAN